MIKCLIAFSAFFVWISTARAVESSGLASCYSELQSTASGERFNPNELTAAHKTLPFGTRVRVTNRRNGKSVVARINDRGPYVKGRIIDLSWAAAQAIGMDGVAPVTLDTP
jgi:rare lipoprotein A